MTDLEKTEVLNQIDDPYPCGEIVDYLDFNSGPTYCGDSEWLPWSRKCSIHT